MTGWKRAQKKKKLFYDEITLVYAKEPNILITKKLRTVIISLCVCVWALGRNEAIITSA